MLVRAAPFSEPEDVTPPGFNVRTTVHEYGGGTYLLHDGVGLLLELRGPTPVPPGAGRRSRADHARLRRPRSVRGRTDHAGRSLADLRAGASPRARRSVRGRERARRDPARRIVGADRDPLGSRLLRHPAGRPRTAPGSAGRSGISRGCRGTATSSSSAISRQDGTLGNVRAVAGRAGEESIFQPAWSPAGDLHFASDRTGWWNLYREHDGEIRPLHPAGGRVRVAAVGLRASAYGFLDDGRIACLWERDGVQHLAILDPGSGELIDLDVPHTAMSHPARRRTVTGWCSSAAGRPSPTRSCSSTSPLGRSTCSESSSSLEVDEAYDLDPPADRVPDRRRRHGVRALLPPAERGHRRPRRRAAAVDRDQPRRADGRGRRRATRSRRSSGRAAGSRSSTSTTAGAPGSGGRTASGCRARGGSSTRPTASTRRRGWPPRARSTGTGC